MGWLIFWYLMIWVFVIFVVSAGENDKSFKTKYDDDSIRFSPRHLACLAKVDAYTETQKKRYGNGDVGTISNQNSVPKDAEMHCISNFLVEKKVSSKYSPGESHTSTIGMKCPRCEHLGPKLSHWERYDCPECGLNMYLAGAGLQIWGENFNRKLPNKMSQPLLLEDK